MASPFLATIDETPDSAYPRLVEGREYRGDPPMNAYIADSAQVFIPSRVNHGNRIGCAIRCPLLLTISKMP